MEELFSLLASSALKLLIGMAVVYAVAVFLVSLTRLLPFLAIASSVATIISVSYIRQNNAEELIWLPVVLSIASQLFYRGEGFMNPKIHENLYSLVNVERKWNSLFADHDDYELHFSPVETGGFFANSALCGILFFLYFDALIFPNTESWLVYILPIYVIGMSIVDAVIVFGVEIPAFFYWCARILMIILSVTIGFLGAPVKDQKALEDEKLYERCKAVTAIDYTRSYSVEYTYSKRNENWKWDELEAKRFLYDSALDVGAEYSIVDYEKVYGQIFAKNPENADEILRFYRTNDGYKFMSFAENVGGRFKYSTADILPFENYCEMTLQKISYATQISKNTDRKLLSVYYSAKNDITFDSHPEYEVSYAFYTDADGNPVSLASVECNVYSSDVTYRKQFVYTPIYEDTGLNELFYEDKTLKGYDYTNLQWHYEFYGIDVRNVFDTLRGEIADYDFKLEELRDGASSVYAYDSATGTVALYDGNGEKAENATKNNDFQTYPPDYYIHNESGYLFNAELEQIGVPYGFEPFTFDNANATKVISYAFFEYASETIEIEENYGIENVVKVTVCVKSAPYLDVDIQYSFYLQKLSEYEYSILKIQANLVYNNADYVLTLFPESNAYDVPSPVKTGAN